MTTYYYLNEDKTFRPATMIEWAEQLESLHLTGTYQVADNNLGRYWISTSWLGFNNPLDEEILLFETIIFKKDDANEFHLINQNKYPTYAEAQEGHKDAMAWVINEINGTE